jgi:hypothetical protein
MTMSELFWTDPNRTQEVIRQDVTEDMRGGFTLRVTYVRENRAYLNQQIVNVPWTNKQLTIQWEHFRSLLEPGQKETWTAIITGPDAQKAVAEMVAALYDASLDQYLPHSWLQSFAGFRSETSRLSSQFENSLLTFTNALYDWYPDYKAWSLSYRHFPDEILYAGYLYYYGAPAARSRTGGSTDGSEPGTSPAPTEGKTTPE